MKISFLKGKKESVLFPMVIAAALAAAGPAIADTETDGVATGVPCAADPYFGTIGSSVNNNVLVDANCTVMLDRSVDPDAWVNGNVIQTVNSASLEVIGDGDGEGPDRKYDVNGNSEQFAGGTIRLTGAEMNGNVYTPMFFYCTDSYVNGNVTVMKICEEMDCDVNGKFIETNPELECPIP